MLLTPGHRGDVPQAAALLDGLRPLAVVADGAYDASHFRALVGRLGAAAVIPPNPMRGAKPPFDEALYAERNGVERLLGRLKLNRRVATRYEKTARNYLSVVLWAATLVLLR